MKFIPFHQFDLKLPFNKDEVINRIYDNTKPSSLGDNYSHSKIFYGTFTDSIFKISKTLKQHYRNSFNPIAIGEITDDSYYCHVKVTMRPTLPTLLFMFIWIGYFLKGLVMAFLAVNTIIWINLGFIVFGYLLMSLGFWFEAPKLESSIKKLLDDKERDI